MPSHDPYHRFRRSVWGMIAFGLGFAALIVVVGRWYLIPAMQASMDATPGQKQQLSAYSLLLMAIMLFAVICGLLLVFRISRFFFPAPPTERTQTKYVDAWAEASKRMKVDPDEDA
jgi:hypothetical protein